MGVCLSKARVAEKKANDARDAADRAEGNLQAAASIVKEVSVDVDSSGVEAAAVVVEEVNSIAAYVVPWLVGTLDTLLPAVPFGGALAKLISKCYKQACALQDAAAEAKSLGSTIAAFAADLDSLNAVLADLKAALEGGGLGPEDTKKVEQKLKELENKMKALQAAMKAMGDRLEGYANEKRSATKAGKKFLFAKKDLEQFQSYHDQLHKDKNGMTDDKGMLSLLLITAFFKTAPGAAANAISPKAVLDVLRRDHDRILAREDNKEVRDNLAVYVPLMYGLHKPPMGKGEQPLELMQLMTDLVVGGGGVESVGGGADATSPATSSPTTTPRVVLLQGAAGTGKSLFGWRMMQYYDKELGGGAASSAQARMPVVVNLPIHKAAVLKALSPDYDGDFLLEKLVESYDLDAEVVRAKLKQGLDALRTFREGRFVFILDGVDELGQYTPNPAKPEHTTAFPIGKLYHLDKWPNSVFVVSSRTDFFKDDKDMLQFCGPREQSGAALLKQAEDGKLVKQIHLLSFAKAQQDLYVKNFASVFADMHPGWNEARFIAALKENSHLQELLTEPLMMYLVLNVLPMLKSDTGASSKLRLNPLNLDVEADPPYVFPTFKRAEIYALFTHAWLVREAKRNGRWDAVAGKVEEDFLKDVVSFCRTVAFHMFTSNVTQISIASKEDLQVLESTKDKLATKYKEAAKRMEAADKTIMGLLKSEGGDTAFRCSPLKKSGNVYSFLHKTIQEFFTASHLTRNLLELKSEDGDGGLDVLLKEGKFNHPSLLLNQQLVKTENVMNTLRFCGELVDRRVQWYLSVGTLSPGEDYIPGLTTDAIQPSARALWDIVQGSRSPKARESGQHDAAATAAANALMILISSGVQFEGCNFSNAVLGPVKLEEEGTFGDFSGGIFANCDFRGSNLIGARMDGCDFSGAHLDEADWTNVSVGQLPMLLGHSREVLNVCVTPDGKYVVSGSTDRTVRVWSLESGEQVRRLDGHSEAVRSVCVTPDGKHVVSGSDDNTVRVWLLESGEQVRQLDGHTDAVWSVCVTPDGKYVVSGSVDKTVRVWALESGEQVHQLDGHTMTVTSVCVTPDGKHVVSGAWDHSVRVWTLESGEQVRQLDGYTGAVYSVCVTPDGKHVVSGSVDKSVRVWSLESGEQVRQLDGHTSAVMSVCVTPDGKHVVSGSDDKTVRVWSLESGEQVRQLDGHTDWVTSVCVTPNGKHVVSGSNDNTVRVWSLESGEQVRQLDGHTDTVWSVCVTPDGKHVVSGSTDWTVRVWSLESGEQVGQLDGHTEWVSSVCMTPYGNHVVSGSYDKSVRVWSLESGEQVRQLDGHTDTVRSVCVTPDGKHVVSGSNDMTVRVWSLESGEQMRQLDGHTGAVHSVCVTPDGKHAVSGSTDKTVRVWSLESGEQLRQLDGHANTGTSVCVTPDGKHVVSGSSDSGTVRVWSLESGEQVLKLDGHTSAVTSVCVTPDGKHVVSGSDDKTVRVWSLESGEQVRQLDGHTRVVSSVCVTLDGKHVVSGSWDKTVRVWSLESNEFILSGGKEDFFRSSQKPGLGGDQVSVFPNTNAVIVKRYSSNHIIHRQRIANFLSFKGCTFGSLTAPAPVLLLISQLNAQN